MMPQGLICLALVSSIFSITSETTELDRHISKDLNEDDAKSTYSYNIPSDNEIIKDGISKYRQTSRMRHFNVNSEDNRRPNIDQRFISNKVPSKLDKTHTHENNKDYEKHFKPKDEEMRLHDVNARSKRDINIGDPCKDFNFTRGTTTRLSHPKAPGESTYLKNATCITTIEALDGQVIELRFVDFFAIEDHPECKYDYLEIRNGKFGYALPTYKFCGKHFPPTITSTVPYMWLKFKSDDIIEYEGFSIDIAFPIMPTSHAVPESCYKTMGGASGVIDSDSTDLQTCRDTVGALDVQWKIEAEEGSQLYLNITKFQMAAPNNCTENIVQVFGAQPNFDYLLGSYCSSVAKSLWTEVPKTHHVPANIMYVRFYTTDRKSNFTAIYTQFRTAGNDITAPCEDHEYDCKDATCIDKSLRCDGIAHCRLKNDEDPVECKGEAESLVRDKDTRTILIVFSLILSGMISVFLFKCIRKFYLDQKEINKHRAEFIDCLNQTAKQISLDRPRASKDSGSSSLHHQNHANERHMHHQQKSSSLESDLLRVPVDVDDEWPDSVPILGDRRHYRGRPTRDMSGKEDLLRGKGSKEENRGLSIECQEVQEAECQTRDSLFQTDPILPWTNVSGSKSGPNSRAVSGVAGSPAPASQLTMEFLRQSTAQDPGSSQNDGRPLSSETTKSAPDVIQIY